jgi:hypothetical protein
MDLETLSLASGYRGHLQKKPKKGVVTSLPKHIQENMHAFQFGIGTLPSDNMNMVMTHEFEHAFVSKLRQKQAIEFELERIASLQQKNAKHNIYITKAQALRDQVARHSIERLKSIEQEEQFYFSKISAKV